MALLIALFGSVCSPRMKHGQHVLHEKQPIGRIVDVCETQHLGNLIAPAVLEKVCAAHQLLGHKLAQAHAE
jgi:hypothetical protein